MFTTKREENEVYAREATVGGVGLLERKPVAENVAGEVRAESVDEAKLRMQRNLDKLLHYDETDYSASEVSAPEKEKAEPITEVYDVQTALAYAAQVKAQQKLEESRRAEEEAAYAEAMRAQASAYVEEPAPVIEPSFTEESDIRPTSTTMQFGEGEADNVYNDLTKTRENAKSSYKLNAKGKIVVALYAVAVMVILALIVLNTGVLASIKSNNSALAQNITELSGQYEELIGRIEEVSSDEYVSDVAENIYNMIKR